MRRRFENRLSTCGKRKSKAKFPFSSPVNKGSDIHSIDKWVNVKRGIQTNILEKRRKLANGSSLESITIGKRIFIFIAFAKFHHKFTLSKKILFLS
jgi:hypothetical protein